MKNKFMAIAALFFMALVFMGCPDVFDGKTNYRALLNELGVDRAVIINADDFGQNEAVNRGIEDLYKLGTISSASLMVHEPAVDDAVAIIKANGIPAAVHLTSADPKQITLAESKGFTISHLDFHLTWVLDKSQAYLDMGFAKNLPLRWFADEARLTKASGEKILAPDSYHLFTDTNLKFSSMNDPVIQQQKEKFMSKLASLKDMEGIHEIVMHPKYCDPNDKSTWEGDAQQFKMIDYLILQNESEIKKILEENKIALISYEVLKKWQRDGHL